MRIAKANHARYTCRISLVSHKRKQHKFKAAFPDRDSFLIRVLSYDECLRLYGSKEYADKLHGFSRVVE